MWELDHKEGWAPENWCFRTVVLERTFETPSDSKKINPVSLKGNQPWIFIERTDAEAEAPILWPPDAKSQLIGKDPDAGKGLEQEEKRAAEDEIDGWMASPTQYTWASSRRWWRTGKPGVLQSVGSQRAGHDWARNNSNVDACPLGAQSRVSRVSPWTLPRVQNKPRPSSHPWAQTRGVSLKCRCGAPIPASSLLRNAKYLLGV